MPGRVRLVTVLVGFLGLAGALGVEGARAASIVLNLGEDGTLSVIPAGGTPIRTSSPPGVVIPPGLYNTVVNNAVPEFRDSYHMFHLSGPGVNLQTDLLAGDDRSELHTVTLLPNSIYIFLDDRAPQVTRVVFSTSGSGTAVAEPSGGSTSSSSSGGTSAGSSSTSKSSTSNKDSVGSGIVAFRGILSGGVSTTGRLSLIFKGKKVSSLKSGRYKISVLDETSSSAFTLQRLAKRAVAISSRSFVGRRTVTLTLGVGQWMYYSPSGKKSFFLVVAG